MGSFCKIHKKNNNISSELLREIYNLATKKLNLAMGRSMRFKIIETANCPKDLIDIVIKNEYEGLS